MSFSDLRLSPSSCSYQNEIMVHCRSGSCDTLTTTDDLVQFSRMSPFFVARIAECALCVTVYRAAEALGFDKTAAHLPERMRKDPITMTKECLEKYLEQVKASGFAEKDAVKNAHPHSQPLGQERCEDQFIAFWFIQGTYSSLIRLVKRFRRLAKFRLLHAYRAEAPVFSTQICPVFYCAPHFWEGGTGL